MKTDQTKHIAISGILNQMRSVCGGGFKKPDLAGIDWSDIKDYILVNQASEADVCDAMGLLSRVNSSKEVVSFLEKIALDPKRSIIARTTAVMSLSQQEAKIVEPSMIKLLAKGDFDLQHRVISWLGTHGSVAAYEALGAVQKRVPKYLHERLQNFQGLVAYRHALSHGELDLNKVVYPKYSKQPLKKSIKLIKPESSKGKSNFSSLGFELIPALTFQPEGCEWDYTFFQRQDLNTALKALSHNKKQVLGVLTYFDLRSDTYHAMHYVLAVQNDKQVEISLMNPKGWLAFTGQLEGSLMKLRSTNRHPGHYTEIQVDLRNLSTLQMHESPGSFQKLRPVPIEN